MLVRPSLMTRHLRLPFLDEIGVISQLALAQNRVAGIDDLWLETGENLFDIDGRDFKEEIGLEYRQHPFHVLVQIPLTGHIQLQVIADLAPGQQLVQPLTVIAQYTSVGLSHSGLTARLIGARRRQRSAPGSVSPPTLFVRQCDVAVETIQMVAIEAVGTTQRLS